jgi:hypothetical protein
MVAASWRLTCVPWGDVFGDAYMALECAFHVFSGELWSAPSQPIYGHGLCLSYAPLFVGAENLFDVANRRAVVGSLVVPGYYLVAVTAASRLFGAGPIPSRTAAMVLALLALRSDLLALMGTSGTLGYFAPVLTLAVGYGLLRATTGKAPVAALLAFAAVPLAMMNHPFTLWLAPAAVLMLPGIRRHNGAALSAACLGAMGLCAGPRLAQLARLIEGNGLVAGLRQIADPGSTPNDLWEQLWPMIFSAGNLPVVAGLLFLILSPLVFTPLSADRRREQILWAVCGFVSFVITVSTGVALGYLRYYHLMFLHPFAVAGLAGAIAKLITYLWHRESEHSTKQRATAFLCSALVVLVCLLPAYGTTSTPLTPACMGGAPLTKEAGGCDEVADAIMADSGTSLLTVDNLTGPSGGADSAVPVVMDLLVRGVSPDRLYAPGRDSEMTWYWIIDRFEITGPDGKQIDFAALSSQVRGAEVLLDLQRSGELVLVVRNEQARLAMADTLCAALAPDVQLWGRTYKTWIGQLVRPGSTDIQYPEPYAPCLALRIIE